MEEQSGFRTLREEERMLIHKLLGTRFPGRDELATQLDTCLAKPLDPSGSLELTTSILTQASVGRRVPVEGEFEDEDGVVVHVLLHVVGGFLRELEIYKEDLSDSVAKFDLQNLRVFLNE